MTPMLPVVAFFGTFLLFLLAGLGALAVTALLDRFTGKERALLLYAVGLVALTWVMRPLPPPPVQAETKTPTFDASVDPASPLKFVGDVFARTPLKPGDRNTFREHSDTNPLPPAELAAPPAVALAFPLPPTVPGAGAPARRVYRGAVPTVAVGDGSKLPQVPADTFSSYTPKPEDVFDWIIEGGKRFYVYILAIDGVPEGKPEFDGPKGLKWNLALKGEPPAFDKDWRSLVVKWAAVGPEEAAAKVLNDVRKAKGRNVNDTTKAEEKAKADDPATGWFLRRTVDNLFVETCRAHGGATPDAIPFDQLKGAAAEMARVGESGKEDGAGWRRAVDLLKLALEKGRARGGTFDPTDTLLALIEAHRAMHDEKEILATLREYDEKQDRADGAAWIGDIFLDRLVLPAAAEAFFEQAIALDQSLRNAWIGKGDSLTLLGQLEGALEAYRKAGSAGRGGGADVAIREAEALLRLGRLLEARRKIDEALASAAYDARALVAKGAIQYATNDLAGARDTFSQAAALPGDGVAGVAARRHRGEALYDLGLTEWRLGHGDAARDAFSASEAALRTGSSRGRSPDETVSPELGRALLSFAAGQDTEATEALDRSRAQAPGIAYTEMLAGVIANRQEDPTTARRAFERALALEPDLYELDGWIAEARLRIAEGAAAAGVPQAETQSAFEGAIQFAERAAAREKAADPASADLAVREALSKTRDQHLSERKRFEAALKTSQKILDLIAREERRALAIKGFCNYRLGPYGSYPDEKTHDPIEPYSECVRNFQQVLDVAAPADDLWKKYAADCLKKVKHWQSLEEKVITFTETKLSTEWEADESQGVRAAPDDGRLRFWTDRKGVAKDGSIDQPSVKAYSRKLFDKSTFERLELMVWVPKKDKTGATANQITFGIQIQGQTTGGGAGTRVQGLGIYYERGKMAVRVGGGLDALYKDGDVHRLQVNGADKEWPDTENDQPARIEIERTDEKNGMFVVRVNGEEVLKDTLPSFKGTKGTAELWLGGWSNQNMQWDVAVDNLRIIRRRP